MKIFAKPSIDWKENKGSGYFSLIRIAPYGDSPRLKVFYSFFLAKK